jgi:hypothetical protein
VTLAFVQRSRILRCLHSMCNANQIEHGMR